ncbi:MAG TPA: iron ABC transporter permease [Microthrixaceae bacterium]|nr:iron ABC transporter permease [Microthrixaceae bacterium]
MATDNGMKARHGHLSASRHRSGGVLGPGVVIGVLCLVMIPVLAVLTQAFRPDGDWGLEAVVRILGQSRTWRLLAVTLTQAVLSAMVTVAVGVFASLVIFRYRFRFRSALLALATVPFVLPSVVIGAAFGSLFGPQGVVDARGTWWVIIIAHTAFNLAVVIRTVGAAIAGLDPDVEAAARMLGESPFGAYRRVVVPAILPAIASSAAVVFLYSLTSFGVIVILGGGSVTTMEVEIWTRATRQFDLSGAGVLAILQFVAVLATVWLHSRITKRSYRNLRVGRRRPLTVPTSIASKVLVGSTVLLVGAISGLPLLALLERSLRVGDSYGINHWQNLGSVLSGTGLQVSALSAVLTSLFTASIATVVVLAIAVPATRFMVGSPGGFAEKVLLIPLGVSATTIGLGFLLAFGRPPVDLRRSILIVPLAQVLVSLPLVVRVLIPAARALPGSMVDAAAMLGSRRSARFWRVELPLLKLAAAAAAGLGFVSCLGEFGATVFLARSDRPTIPVLIERLLSRPGEAGFGQAMVLSVIMVVICGTALACVDRFSTGSDGMSMTF